jgi:hypothetical protein
MAEKYAVELYKSEKARHLGNARDALEYAAQRIASALEQLDKGPSSTAVADARHATQYAAEGYAAVQAYVALHDVRFLTGSEETP